MASGTLNIPIYDQGFEALHAAAGVPGGFVRETEHHVLVHIPGEKRLVVAFDNLATVEVQPRKIFGQALIKSRDWGALGVLAKRKDWYRSASLFDALHRVRDDGLFSTYPATSFYGASMGAYGALAFSALAPGAAVMAFAPQSTLCTQIAPFETRYRYARRFTDWTGPYADAAAAVDAAGRVQIVYDPTVPQDAAHAARLAGPNVHLLPQPYLTHKVPPALMRMGVLKTVALLGLEGQLDPFTFRRLMRARHTSLPWTRNLLEEAARRGHTALALRVIDSLLEKDDHRKLRDLRRHVRALHRG